MICTDPSDVSAYIIRDVYFTVAEDFIPYMTLVKSKG